MVGSMATDWFDLLIRTMAIPAPRRAVGRFLAGAGLSGLLAQIGGRDLLAAGADKKRKEQPKRKPKQKPKFNEFGCVNVGNFCTKSNQCCSGICGGNKDKKTCRGHNTGSPACVGGDLGFCAEQPIFGTECTSSQNVKGICTKTTGKAPYCAASEPETSCSRSPVLCNTDPDCQAFCGPDAACVLCPRCAGGSPGVTRVCAGPAVNSCVF